MRVLQSLKRCWAWAVGRDYLWCGGCCKKVYGGCNCPEGCCQPLFKTYKESMMAPMFRRVPAVESPQGDSYSCPDCEETIEPTVPKDCWNGVEAPSC